MGGSAGQASSAAGTGGAAGLGGSMLSSGGSGATGGLPGTAGVPSGSAGRAGTTGLGGALFGGTLGTAGANNVAGAPGTAGSGGQGGTPVAIGGQSGAGGAGGEMIGNGGGPGSGGAAGAGGAPPRYVRPNILFLFDNSGSMQERASGTWVGENTNICPATTDSKIYGAKNALRAVLADLGSQANVGLLSFPIQARTPPVYAKDTWCTSAGRDIGPVGHYQPTPARPGRNAGCDMTTHESETTFGPWFTAGVSEVLRVGVTTAPAGLTPAASNYDPADANIPAVRRWIDNVELPLDPGAVTDPELHGMTGTPLGRSLLYARLYFDNFVKPADPNAACRLNTLIVLTDGIESCDMTAPDTTFDAATCQGGGTSFSQLHPIYQACRLRLDSGIKTTVITDSGLSTSELLSNDLIAKVGGTTAAIRVSLADVTPAKAAIAAAIAAGMASGGGCSAP